MVHSAQQPQISLNEAESRASVLALCIGALGKSVVTLITTLVPPATRQFGFPFLFCARHAVAHFSSDVVACSIHWHGDCLGLDLGSGVVRFHETFWMQWTITRESFAISPVAFVATTRETVVYTITVRLSCRSSPLFRFTLGPHRESIVLCSTSFWEHRVL